MKEGERMSVTCVLGGAIGNIDGLHLAGLHGIGLYQPLAAIEKR